MQSSRRLVLSEAIATPDGGRALQGDQRLHNDLLGRSLSLSLSLSLSHTHLLTLLSFL